MRKNNYVATGVPRLHHKKKWGEILFFSALIAYPVAQFCVFYIGVNFNSILLSFKTFDIDNGAFVFTGFNNFKKLFYDIGHDVIMQTSMKNSIIVYAISMLVVLPLNLLFSFFLYKKIPGTKFFRVVLFLPQVLSAITMSLLYKFFIDKGLPGIFYALGFKGNFPALLVDRSTSFIAIVFYWVWAGFGMQLILYSSAMSRIPDSLVEYGKLEGLPMFKEFYKITLPLIFPTITTFLIAGVASIFVNNLQVFNFFGNAADYNLYTLGYLFFIKVVQQEASFVEYPYAAAAGMMFTVVAVPLTLGVKFVLDKITPATEY